MRIVKIEDLHCTAGWRDFSFLAQRKVLGNICEIRKMIGKHPIQGDLTQWNPHAAIGSRSHAISRFGGGAISVRWDLYAVGTQPR